MLKLPFWSKADAAEKSFHARQLRRLFFLTVLVLLVYTIIFGVFYSYIVDKLLSSQIANDLLPEELMELSSIIPGVRETLIWSIIVIMLLNIVMTLIVGVIITHKLASPLYHFKMAAKKMGEGRLDVSIHLNRGDEFKDLAKDLNSAIARIQLMIMAVKENVLVLESELDLKHLDKRLKDAIDGCHEALTYFETVDLEDPLLFPEEPKNK